ncbi:uncharacterized protein LOC124411357 [Diprion similis]|uniref:uncharacterized protein LOC124411357 n=1 Tax=Diprion similis TaxID=362088 RepID=UPI001EF7B9CD|nr:uncharacterized protein LOC124411357 [Diprion similis]
MTDPTTLLVEFRAERTQYQRVLDSMMAQLTQMTQLLGDRDKEIVTLRERADRADAQLVNTTNSEEQQTNYRIPYTEIASQVPPFGNKENEAMSLDMWLKRIDEIQTLYNLSDDTVKILATNKFTDGVRKWYETCENACGKDWATIREEVKQMFDEDQDPVRLMDKIKNRRWRKGERLEDYYLDKLNLTKKAKMTDAEIISYIIRGIDNFTIRTQLVAARHVTPTSLFKDLRLLSIEMSNWDKPKDPKDGRDFRDIRIDAKKKTLLRCEICEKENHTSDRCHWRQSKDNRRGPPTCFKCGQEGHISRLCTNPSTVSTSERTGMMHIRTADYPRDTSRYYKTIKVQGGMLSALIDTGSTLNLIKEHCIPKVIIHNTNSQLRTLRGFGNAQTSSSQVLEYEGLVDGKMYKIPAAVVPNNSCNVDLVLGQAFLDSVDWTVKGGEITFQQRDNQWEDAAAMVMNIEVEATEPDAPKINFGSQVTPTQKMKVREEISGCLSKYNPNEVRELPVALRIDVKNDRPVRCTPRRLSHHERDAVEKILENYFLALRIDVKNDRPVRCTPRRLSHHERDAVEKILENYLTEGIIRPSNSEYSSPIVLVKKKTGEYRLCIDYRELNKLTVKDSFPLPHIDDLISNLSGASYFTTIDLKMDSSIFQSKKNPSNTPHS